MSAPLSPLPRRQFLASAAAFGACAAGFTPAPARAADSADHAADPISFFLVGDTHYLARKDQPRELDPASQQVTSRFIDAVNRLPGTEIPREAGGGQVARPRGLIHAGDVIDSGDKTGPALGEMQRREWQGFVDDFGLTGKDGKLSMPVYEIHGNHDGPRGTGVVPDGIKARNKLRPGVTNVSANGLHYAWDWGPVHFINLGIVVGGGPNTKHGRYDPLDSLAFLAAELKPLDPKKPVVITHHVDMARYSGACLPEDKPSGGEWHPCDVRGYYQALAGRNIAAILYGHTHVRNVYRWDGTSNTKATEGIPVFNTDNGAHFHSKTQAVLYFELGAKELVAREYATADAWETGGWTPMVWKMPIAG